MQVYLKGKPLPLRLVVADLDGLCINSEEGPKISWYSILLTMVDCSVVKPAILKRVNIRTFVDFNGLTPTQIRERGIQIFGSVNLFDRAKAIRKKACAAASKEFGFKQMLGVAELLQILDEKAVPKVIVTASTHEDGEAKLEQAGLGGRFDRFYGSDSAGTKAERFAKAAQDSGVAPENCLVLGDAPADASCGIQVGMNVAIVPDLCLPAEFVEFAEEPLFLGLFTMAEIVEALRQAA